MNPLTDGGDQDRTTVPTCSFTDLDFVQTFWIISFRISRDQRKRLKVPSIGEILAEFLYNSCISRFPDRRNLFQGGSQKTNHVTIRTMSLQAPVSWHWPSHMGHSARRDKAKSTNWGGVPCLGRQIFSAGVALLSDHELHSPRLSRLIGLEITGIEPSAAV